MPAQFEYQLFELDRVESALKSIVLAAVSSPAAPVQVLMKREKETEDTPRVTLTLQTQQSQGQRYILNPANTDIRWQPFNTWMFKLGAEIVTNRETNGDQHLPIIGKTRLALQFYKLAVSWTIELAPYHTLINIVEEPIDLAVVSDENTDMTRLNFSGMLCIRDTAWIR